jgi:hypothetical protein
MGRIQIDAARSVASGAERAEIRLALIIQNGLGKNGVGGVSGAEEQ